jgi:hypothetical protein
MATRVRYKEVETNWFVSNRFQAGSNLVQIHIDFCGYAEGNETYGVRICTNEESFSPKVDCSSWERAKKIGKKLLKEAGVNFEIDIRRRKVTDDVPF